MICLRKVSYVYCIVYGKHNVRLPGNAMNIIFKLAVILDFRFSGKAEPK